MTSEYIGKQPTFEVRAESLKERTENFFSTYENPNGGEDRIEICLIREGYMAVLMAEEEINRLKSTETHLETNSQKAEIKRLNGVIKNFKATKERQQADIERLKKILSEEEEKYKSCAKRFYKVGVKDFAERLKKESYPFPCAIGVENAVTIRTIDGLVKEMVGDTE